MCACAGSLTNRLVILSLVFARNGLARKRPVFQVFRRPVQMDHAPGRIGFMSTQRRENRGRRISCTECARALREFISGFIARYGGADANGGTAPPGMIPAWLATNSPHLGYRIIPFVRQKFRHGSPPFRAGLGVAVGVSAIYGSYLLHIPSPSDHAYLYPTWPQDPAGRRRRAERYDGKRNLHFQYAARDATGYFGRRSTRGNLL
jgi:hypothetical protein